MIKLIHSDYRKRIREFAPYDVIITSPPYNIGKKYSTHDDALDTYDYVRIIVDFFIAAKEVISDNGHVFLNIGNTCKKQYLVHDIMRIGKDYLQLQNTILWIKSIFIDKTYGHFKPINSELFLNNNFEYILHYTKEGKTKINKKAIGVPYVDQRNTARFGGDGLTDRGNVWFIPYDTTNAYVQKPDHPAPFPEKLVEMCIKLSGVPRTSKICDPFAGTGSTLVVCKKMDMHGYGFDIDLEYLKEAQKRCQSISSK